MRGHYYFSKSRTHCESVLPATVTLSRRIHCARNDKMKIFLIAALIFAVSSLTYAQTDTAINSDSQSDHGRAGTASGLDGNGQWSSDVGSTNGDIGNDGQWDLHPSGADRDLNNSGQLYSSRAAPINFSMMMLSGIPTMMVKIGI